MSSIALRFFERSGECIVTLTTAFRYSYRLPFRWRAFMREMWVVGIESLPLVCFFLFLIGMVFALQTGVGLADFGQEDMVGQLVAMGMVRELGPWMTAFVMVARNGSSMAAEIGTMKVSEEISALRLMSINPLDYIVMPRLWAFIIMAPVLTIIATGVGIVGGGVVAVFQLGTSLHVYIDRVSEGVLPPLVLYWGILKSLVFALTMVAVGCTFGLATKGGALGVGKASRDTVVVSLVLIVLFNFVLTSFYIVLTDIWEGA